MKTIKERLVPVTYHAYSEAPFAPDASGFVPESKLLDAYDEKYVYYTPKSDTSVERAGFRFVWTEEGDRHTVRETNIFTRVYPEKVLEGGWGADYPGGGSASTSAPTHADADGEFYSKSFWG